MRNTKSFLVGLFLLVAGLLGPSPFFSTAAIAGPNGSPNTGNSSTALLAPSDHRQLADNSTTKTKEKSPEKIYDEAWVVIQQNFLYRNRLKNWKQWRHKFDGKLATRAEAEKAIKKMLASLEDEWTFYKSASTIKEDTASDRRSGVVTHELLPGNIGYIKIETFNSICTAEETQQAFKAMPGAKAFIIDLRENGGGFIYQAFEVFSLLADSGTMTTLKGHYMGGPYLEKYVLEASLLVLIENGEREEDPRRPNLLADRPLVVLVNENSASASELLVGALKDMKIATVIGATTYGKGVAQVTKELSNGGAVRVTFARFFSPNGHCPHNKGVVPHIDVPEEDGHDAPLETAIDYLK